MRDEDGLFVYGTLRFPEILRTLLGRVPDLSPATAAGYRVRALPGVVYPGLVADPGAKADGLLITGLDETERRLLDAYEGDEYEQVILPLDRGRRGRAYLWKGPAEPFDWDPRLFADHELAAFAEGCRAWIRHHPAS